VVIITRDRAAELERTLERMEALPERPPLIVVDNASSDGTAALVTGRFPGVEFVRSEENLGAAGRSLGARRAGTPYVAFCDDDCWWAPGALSRAAAILDAHPRLALISGRVLVGPGEEEDPTCREMENSPLSARPGLPGPAILGFLAGASIVRREPFLEAGGFEPRFVIGSEERLLALDLAVGGWEMAYVKEVVVHHHPSRRRDVQLRRRMHVRNALWVAWLRRPFLAAMGRTVQVLGTGPVEGDVWRGLAEALRELPWVLRRRRVVPDHIDRALSLVEKDL
jgi:GT2 family glycosyltransferase